MFVVLNLHRDLLLNRSLLGYCRNMLKATCYATWRGTRYNVYIDLTAN